MLDLGFGILDDATVSAAAIALRGGMRWRWQEQDFGFRFRAGSGRAAEH